MRHPFFASALFSLLLFGACSQRHDAEDATAPREAAQMSMAAPASPAPAFQAKMAGGGANTAAPDAATQEAAPFRRHVAVRHELRIQTEAQAVETAWRQAHEACAAAGCEVLSSNLMRDDQRRPANGELDVRVPPDRLDAFLKQVSALGSVGQHTKTAEDKTDEVIDTEARLKNMAEFRDNLRRLMATPGARLKDLIDVERELVRVQSEIDSLVSRRKALSNQTDKVRVYLNFTALPSVLETGAWSPVRDAIAGAGRMFARSIAGLITFVVSVLPWLALLVAVVAALRAVWRRRRRARQAVQP